LQHNRWQCRPVSGLRRARRPLRSHELRARVNADKQRAYRERLRGGPPRQPQPHGTRAAIRRHERAGEPLCDACRIERNRLARERYTQRKQMPG
jgi:hypothetical protein